MKTVIEKNEVKELHLSELGEETDVKGVLKITGAQNAFAEIPNTLRMYYGSELYVNSVLCVGKEYDHKPFISLGHGRYDKDPETDPVLIMGKDTVTVDGKIYINKMFADERVYNLGLDSAAVLHADSKLKFRVDAKGETPTAAVYTYGGLNDGEGAVMNEPNVMYFYLQEEGTWYNLLPNIAKFAPSLFGVLAEMNGNQVWNGKPQIDTEAGCDGQKIADIAYTPRGGSRNTYDLWLPKYILDEQEKGKDVPVILFVHGGSWIGGKKEDEEQGCLRYAKMGYVTATINTRLAFQPIPENSGSFFDMITDIKDCVTDILRKLNERGYTSTRMALSGTSAGAHISMLYGTTYGAQSPIPVKLLLPCCGCGDFLPSSWANNRNMWNEEKASFSGLLYDTPEADPEYGQKLLVAANFMAKMIATGGGCGKMKDGQFAVYTAEEMLQGVEDTESEIYKQVTSVSPTLLWHTYKIPCVFRHGEPDTLISVDCVRHQKKVLEDLGVDCCFIISALDWHLQIMDRSAAKAFFDKSKEYLEKYLPLSI